jgi:hypothetical protein
MAGLTDRRCGGRTVRTTVVTVREPGSTRNVAMTFAELHPAVGQ